MRRHEVAPCAPCGTRIPGRRDRIVRRPEEHRHVEAESRAGNRQHFEIAAMGREDDERPRIVSQLQEERDARNSTLPAPARRIEVEELIGGTRIRREPPHIAPAFERDRRDLGIALLGKGVAQIDQRQLVTTGLRPDPAGNAIREVDRHVRGEKLGVS